MIRYLHPQLQQLGTLLVLFVLGYATADIYVTWMQAVALLLLAGGVEHGWLYVRERRMPYVSYSSFSTAFGVMLMLASSDVRVYGAVIVLALTQKHLLRIDGRHFFNPSNFALIAGMGLFYHRAHVVLGQLGDAMWLRMVVLILAGAILLRVDRWIVSLSFVVSYLVAEAVLVVGYDPVMTFEDVYERFMYVSFVVFVAFMLTDPRTTPSRGWLQVVFGAAIAGLAAWLDRRYGFRVQHLFAVLFVLSPWVPLMEARAAERVRVFWASLGVFLLALGVIIALQMQPPYYFEMSG